MSSSLSGTETCPLAHHVSVRTWLPVPFRGTVPAVPRFELFVERILPLTILSMAAIGAPALMFSNEGLPRLRNLQTEIAQVRAENVELARTNAQLHLTVERLKQDPKAVERLARDELGLVRNTEVVFQFPAQR